MTNVGIPKQLRRTRWTVRLSEGRRDRRGSGWTDRWVVRYTPFIVNQSAILINNGEYECNCDSKKNSITSFHSKRVTN